MRPAADMAAREHTCPRCGLTFSSEKLGGLCPGCLLAQTLDAEPATIDTAFWEDIPDGPQKPKRLFSHFEILDELGRGGMGVVYRARDRNTERIIALKVLQAQHLEVPDLVRRFRAEVRAVSSLDHPHVLPIHEVGEYDGIPFFSMKLTTAGSLANSLGNYLGKPREAAQLLAKVARGVQHAHERGILHRDLKPGNVLLDSAGEPYVCDFGLAKWIDDDQKLTLTAAVLGTPHYIAPEQAKGSKALTTAVDIYSLGAILYELLTGRPPFVGGTVLETLVASQDKTPERPSSLAKNVPADLETICLKALQTDPNARYPTAAAFADDLENWLASRPINARPVGAGEQLWRWARRNPLAASLLLTVAVMLTATAIGAVTAAIRLDQARKRAISAEANAKERLYDALLAQANASTLSGRAGQRVEALRAIKQAATIHRSLEARNAAIGALTLTDIAIDRTVHVRARSNLPIAVADDLGSIAVATDSGAIRILDRADGHELYRLEGKYGPVARLIYGGVHYIAARYQNGQVLIWDVATKSIVFRHSLNSDLPAAKNDTLGHVAFDRKENLLALCEGTGGISIYRLPEGEKITTFESQKQFTTVAFDPAGKKIAALDMSTPTVLSLFALDGTNPVSRRLGATAICLDWAPSGDELAVGLKDNSVSILHTAGLETVKTLQGQRQTVLQVLFDHSGSLLALQDQDKTIRLWSTEDFSEQVTLTQIVDEPILKFSADDRELACSAVTTDVAFLDIFDRRKLYSNATSFSNTPNWAPLVSSFDYSPDSKLLATSSYQGLQLWDAEKQILLTSVELDPGAEKNVRFMDPNHILVISRKSGWNLYHVVGKALEPVVATIPASFSSDSILGSPSIGPNILTTSSRGTIQMIDPKLPSLVAQIETAPGVWDAVSDQQSHWLACSFSPKTGLDVDIWTTSPTKLVTKLATGSGATLTVSPDANLLITTGELGTLVWRTHGWTRVEGAQLPDADRAAFSRDGRYIALCESGEIFIIRTSDWQHVATLEPRDQHQASSYRLGFSPDGNQFVAYGYDCSLHFWNLAGLSRELTSLGLNWE